MPVASGGNKITSADSIADGVILNKHINATAGIVKTKLAALAIVNADVDAGAAIAKTKLAALAIVNADVDAGAAIADSKLAAITTAGKVSGAALTLLTNTPSAAGGLPTANITIKPSATLTANRTGNTGSGTQNVAHGLGVIPQYVKITGFQEMSTTSDSISVGNYDGTTQKCIYSYHGANATEGASATRALIIASSGAAQEVVMTFDATNIILTWTLAGAGVATPIELFIEVWL